MEYESLKRLRFLLNNGIIDTDTLMQMNSVSREFTIYNVKKRLRNGLRVERKPGSGSPLSLQPNEKRRISKLAEKHPTWTRKETAKEAIKEKAL
jgi:transposase